MGMEIGTSITFPALAVVLRQMTVTQDFRMIYPFINSFISQRERGTGVKMRL